MSYFWKMSQCNMTFLNLGHSDLYLMVHWFLSFIFCSKNVLVLLAKPDSGELRCPTTALIRVVLFTLTPRQLLWRKVLSIRASKIRKPRRIWNPGNCRRLPTSLPLPFCVAVLRHTPRDPFQCKFYIVSSERNQPDCVMHSELTDLRHDWIDAIESRSLPQLTYSVAS